MGTLWAAERVGRRYSGIIRTGTEIQSVFQIADYCEISNWRPDLSTSGLARWEISCVELAIADELECIAVKVISARFCKGINGRAGVRALLGVLGTGRNLELLQP